MIKHIKIYPILLSVLFFNFVLTACRATPETEAVAQKGEAQMETILDSVVAIESEEADEPVLPSEPYDFPDHLSYTLTSDYADMAEEFVEVEADITVPEYAMPIYSVTSRKVDAQAVIDLMDYLRDGQPVYYREFANAVMTKTKYQEQINYYLDEISMCTEECASMRREYEKIVNDLYEEMAEAPESYSEVTKETIDAERRAKDAEIEDTDEMFYEFEEFDSDKAGEVTMTEAMYASLTDGFSCVFGESKYSDSFTVDNDNVKTKKISYSMNYFDKSGYFSVDDVYQVADMPVSLNSARALAEPVVNILDDSLELTEIMPLITFDRDKEKDDPNYQIPSGLRLVYTHTFSGVKTNYSEGGGWYTIDDSSSYADKYQQEYLVFDVTEKGIETLEYSSPMIVVEKKGDEAELLPFGDIQEIFDSYIVLNHAYAKAQVYISIEEARLGLVRIAVPNESESYLVVPVWDFYGNSLQAETNKGYTYERLKEEALHKCNHGFLTINAIDGSLINRDMGY